MSSGPRTPSPTPYLPHVQKSLGPHILMKQIVRLVTPRLKKERNKTARIVLGSNVEGPKEVVDFCLDLLGTRDGLADLRPQSLSVTPSQAVNRLFHCRLAHTEVACQMFVHCRG